MIVIIITTINTIIIYNATILADEKQSADMNI
jgi:hypothetical protein